MYGKVNPTGCAERYGLIQVRLDFFLEKGDARYDDPRFYQVDPTSKEYLLGYTGKLDKEGQPRDLEAYAAWEASLPRIWLAERCFHHHMIYLDPYSLRDEQITSAMGLHVPNFYKAWTEEWDKVPGGMRHGWDVATRRPRPTRYSVTQPELYDARKAECLSKLPILAASSFATQVTRTGETFPATEIDVGSAAIDRSSNAALNTGAVYVTQVDGNNAANATGTLDTVDAWWNVAASGNSVRIGTFSFSGTTGTCRDAQSIGAVTAGSAQQYTGLDIDIETGDFIGGDTTTLKEVRIEGVGSGGTYYYAAGKSYCVPTTGGSFTQGTGILSLYGTGETSFSTFNESITDSITVGDTPSTKAVYKPAVIDSIAMGDTPSTKAVYKPAVADSIVMGDTPSAKLTFTVSVSDSVTVDDIASAVRNIIASLSDSVATGDTPSGQTTFKPSLTDSIAVGDMTVNQAVYHTELADSIAVGDALTPSLVIAFSLADSIATADTPSCTLTFPLSIADAIAVGDSAFMDILGEFFRVVLAAQQPYQVQVQPATPYEVKLMPVEPYTVVVLEDV